MTTICPFCKYGCELSIQEMNQGNYKLHQIEYLKSSGINQGRLCPRGNSAKILLSHPKRLTYPLFNNKILKWSDIIQDIQKLIQNSSPENIAITYDCNNTLEEFSDIYNFAHALKTENISCVYFHPEQFFNYAVSEIKQIDIKDLNNSKFLLVIGDIFAKSPVISKHILDIKYSDRNNKIFYFDVIKSKLAGFADKFIWLNPNTEPLVLLALILESSRAAKNIISNKYYNELTKLLPTIYEFLNVKQKDIQDICQTLLNNPHSLVLVATDFGKTKDPLLLSLLSQLFASITPSKKYCSLALASIPLSNIKFSTILNKIRDNKIKILIHFGEEFPYYYPQLHQFLINLDVFIYTSMLRSNRDLLAKRNYILPVTSTIEKQGTINTLWSKTTIKPVIAPIDGAKSVSEIITLLHPHLNRNAKVNLNYKSPIDIERLINRCIEYCKNFSINTNSDDFHLIGEESAYNYRGYFNDCSKEVKINPITAKKINIKNNDRILLISNNCQKVFITKIVNYLPLDTVSVSTDLPDNRLLFPIQFDNLTNEIMISSSLVKIQKEKV
ncbi:MAG: hypothetical protein ABIK31_01480 [candidate division WOR-3 bacterium]